MKETKREFYETDKISYENYYRNIYIFKQDEYCLSLPLDSMTENLAKNVCLLSPGTARWSDHHVHDHLLEMFLLRSHRVFLVQFLLLCDNFPTFVWWPTICVRVSHCTDHTSHAISQSEIFRWGEWNCGVWWKPLT